MKFSLEWLGDFVDTSRAGGAEGVRRLLEQAGIPLESMEISAGNAVLDAEITPNRPDAMSHRGLAREIAAMAGLPGKPNERQAPATNGPPAQELASVAIEVPRLCRRFGARVVTGIGGASSLRRVRERLAAIGLKTISAAVDATNYVLWEIGQPLHAFDLDRLRGGRVVVRRARKGERLVTLDGVERELHASDVVVADSDRAVSLAGIMGGLETAVTGDTRNVLFEAAWWDPAAIRKTARRLNLHTDASHRFERGCDPEAIPEALDRAAALLLEAAGGALAPGIIDARGVAWKKRRAPLSLARLRLLSGDDRLDLEFAAEALSRLEFVVSAHGRRLTAEIPTFRSDVAIEEDLVEEVLRVYGYDKLPSRLPPSRRGGGHFEPLRRVEERLSDRAVAAGLFETMSDPFVNRAAEEGPFSEWLAAAGSAALPLALANPLDATRADLRATLLPGLAAALARNLHRGEDAVGLFEIGRVFDRQGNPDEPASFESRRFAFAVAGEWRRHWSTAGGSGAADFFDAKGLAQSLLAPWCPPEDLVWRPFTGGAFAPGAAALFETRVGAPLGVVGLLSRAEREKQKVSLPVFVGEIRIDAIPRETRNARYVLPSPYPSIEADLSFAHTRETPWKAIRDFVEGRRLADLETIRLLDRFEGAAVGQGQVKSTIRLTFRSPERTLSQEEVNPRVSSLAAELQVWLERAHA